MRIVPASQAKNNFGEVIKRVYEHAESQIIERDGVPVVAIVTIGDLERLYPGKVKAMPRVAASGKRQQAMQRLLAFLEHRQVDSEQFLDSEVEADVLKTTQEVRHGERKPA